MLQVTNRVCLFCPTYTAALGTNRCRLQLGLVEWNGTSEILLRLCFLEVRVETALLAVRKEKCLKGTVGNCYYTWWPLVLTKAKAKYNGSGIETKYTRSGIPIN